jgi:hypothetical protein
MSMENDGGMILTGKNRRTRRKTCTSATLSTTNPTWIPGSNTVRSEEITIDGACNICLASKFCYALCRADPLPNCFYQMCKRVLSFRGNSEVEQATRPNPYKLKRNKKKKRKKKKKPDFT